MRPQDGGYQFPVRHKTPQTVGGPFVDVGIKCPPPWQVGVHSLRVPCRLTLNRTAVTPTTQRQACAAYGTRSVAPTRSSEERVPMAAERDNSA